MFPKPIFWHSGQFLEPQHFQDTDWCNHHARTEILKLCRPFYEGVIRLDVTPAVLAEGTLTFDAAELVFIDGSHIVWTGRREDGNASPIVRILPAEWSGETMTVYGRLAPFRERYNVAGLDKQEPEQIEAFDHMERYDAWVDERDTPDRYVQKHVTLSNDGCPLTRINYHVRLLWDSELGKSEGGMVMPLLRLRKKGNDVIIDPDFIPPLAAVKGSRRLNERLREFMDVLGAFPRRVETATGSGVPAIAELLTRQSVARLLADLDSLLQWDKCHPYDIYRSIRNACMEILASGRADAGFEELPIPCYDHYNLTTCLPKMIESCERLLMRFLPEVVAVIEPEYSQGILVFHLPEVVMSSGIAFCLSIKSDEPLRTVLAEGRLIAGTPDAVRDAIKLALPELPLSIVSTPRGLSTQDGTTYLVPGVNHGAWKKVMAARSLALAYYPSRDPGAVRLQTMARLYALRGS